MDSSLSIISGISFQNISSMEKQAAQLMDDTLNEALELFFQGNFELFDPLVGDTACQIRAVKLIDLYKKIQNKGMAILNENDKQFIVLSYLLTKVKFVSRSYKGYIDYNCLDSKKLNLELSKRKSNELLLLLQRKLARLSIDFLQEIANYYNHYELKIAFNYILLDYKTLQRPNCAAYPTMKALLLWLSTIKGTLHIKVYSKGDNFDVYNFYYSSNGKEFIQVDDQSINPNEPMLLIEGFSRLMDTDIDLFKNHFLNFKIEDILLAFLADHKQFVGKKAPENIPFDELRIIDLKTEYTIHKKFAAEHGCSKDNINLFAGHHASISSIKK